MKIKFLKAYNGDSIHISFKEGSKNRNILIDGGMCATYMQKNKKGNIEFGELKDIIDLIKERKEIIDLLILTHVDDDHIGGILKWFENDESAYSLIGKVWFNSGRLISEHFKVEEIKENLIILNPSETTDTSIGQGIIFEDYIEEKDIWDRKLIKNNVEFKYLGLVFKILSPSTDKLKLLLKKWEEEYPDSIYTAAEKNDYDMTLSEHIEVDKFKEDTKEHNGSSIAIVITYNEKNIVFLGDAHPTVVANSLKYFKYTIENPLNAELVKISHHGSKANSSIEMINLINTKKYVISTNGDRHAHPNKQFLGRLASINNDCEIYFNYPEQIKTIFLEQDYKDFPNFKPLVMNNNEISI